MASESTPLIRGQGHAPYSQAAWQKHRQQNRTCRRFFTISATCIFLWGLCSFFFNVLFVWPYHYHREHNGRYSGTDRDGKVLSHDELKSILLETPDADKAREWSKYYASGAHLAGKNFSQVKAHQR